MGRGSIRSRKEKAKHGYDRKKAAQNMQRQNEAPPTDLIITKRQTVTREGKFEDARICFNTHHRVAMEFCTGFGKTYAALRLIAEDLISTKGARKWYILIPRNVITQTWFDEMDKWGYKWMYKHGFVDVINYSSSHKLEAGRNFCLDEAHNITDLRESNMSSVVDKRTRIIAASATIDTEKFTILRTFGFNKQHRIVVTLDQGVEAGAVTGYAIYRLPLSMNLLFKQELSAKNRWLTACKKKQDQKGIEAAIFAQTRQIYNSYQKLMAAQYVVNQFDTSDKFLVYCSNQNFAEQLSELTGLPVMHSNQKDKEREKIWTEFQEVKTGGLISCYTISEGVTIEGVSKALVVQTRKNERELIQRLGRLLRWDGKEEGEIGKLYLMYIEDCWDEKWADSSTKSFNPDRIFEYRIPLNKYKTERSTIENENDNNRKRRSNSGSRHKTSKVGEKPKGKNVSKTSKRVSKRK